MIRQRGTGTGASIAEKSTDPSLTTTGSDKEKKLRLRSVTRSSSLIITIVILLFLISPLWLLLQHDVYSSSSSIKTIQSSLFNSISISNSNNDNQTWKKQVCVEGKYNHDPTCHHVHVLTKRKTTFCSAAKVASTTTRDYFLKISDGEVVIPPNAKFGAHGANWKRLAHVDPSTRYTLLTSSQWTHVLFIRKVLDRFISGYLDKIKSSCDNPKRKRYVIQYYQQFGFSCDKHSELKSFVSFLESVPVDKWEGHFAPQIPLCNPKQFPYTHVIMADEHLNDKLKDLSNDLGVTHPQDDAKTTSHGTGAKNKLLDIFKNKPLLIERILALFKDDCDMYPELCDVGDLYKAIALDLYHTMGKQVAADKDGKKE